MENKRFSRRRFIEMSSLLAAVTATSSAAAATSLWVNTPTTDEVPDLATVKQLLKQKDALMWVFAGDSITMGLEHTHGCESFPEIFEERVRWELRRLRDIVVNTGVSGNTAQNILDDFDWRIGQFKPAVVSLMIGTNDCGGYDIAVFEKNVELLLTRIRQLNAVPILHTPNIVIIEKSPSRKRLPEFAAAVRRVAERNKVILVDNWAYWETTLRDHPEVNVYRNWLNDPLHPNQTGHQEIARLMFKELSIFDPAAASCGGKYYEGDH
jgi:acyl-CoA thioesterase-1